MDTEQNTERGRSARRMSYIFGIFMLLIYWGMSYLLLFSPMFRQQMSPGIRYTMGSVFLVYGIWRGWRLMKYKK